MKKLSMILAVLLTTALCSSAQQFQKKMVTPLNEKLQAIQLDWLAMDADTLMDLVITGVAADGQWKIQPYQNLNTTSYFVRKNAVLSGMKTSAVQIADWNRDNKMDLIAAGKTMINTDAIFVFTSQGDHTFQKVSQKLLEHAGFFRVGDLNNDAVPDLVTAGQLNNVPFIHIYENSPTGLIQRLDITGTFVTDLAIFDINNDGINDLIVSGRDLQNKPVTSTYYGKPQFKFGRKNVASPVDGSISLSDINDDGRFDLIAISYLSVNTWINLGDTLKLHSTVAGLREPYLFTGDMTSDGKPDALLLGLNTSNERSNFIRELNGINTTLDTTGLIAQRMGDQDRDGDLDLVQVIDSVGSQWLKFYENTTVTINRRPDTPANAFAVSTFDKTFLFWDTPVDDHTNKLSLTYDVWIGTQSTNIVTPSFDRNSGRRMIVRHGNVGTATSIMVRGLADNLYYYGVQSVDNAYNGSYSIGSGSVLPCFDLTHEYVQACKGGSVKLGAGGQAQWFSTTRGKLEVTDTLRFVATAADTIFAVVPQQFDCSKNRVFVLRVNEAPPSEQETIYACKGKTIKLEIAEGWHEISWNLSPAIKNVSFIDYLVNDAATVIATAKSQGCTYKKEFTIRLSEPTVAIAGEGFQILKGATVQLDGSGTATTWQWTPPSGLSNTAIPNPVATPAATTEYILTGTDSVGCSATAKILVTVQENAFVPNLFTPNGDGKNDNLMIYGLSSTSSFKFRIFNREGSLVYETEDARQAATSGWNGFVQGTRQPSGIYYWRVDGETPGGDKLLLNGKVTGSILLVH
jgi:gliding motility-associated-like protein